MIQLVRKHILTAFQVVCFLIQSLIVQGQQTEHTLSTQQLDNLIAFSKTYGYIRFFYPNESTNDLDWDAFLIYGIDKVKNAKDQQELKSVLEILFKPLAPHIAFSKTELTRLRSEPILQGDSIVFWQHSSFSIGENKGVMSEGDDIKILVHTVYDSTKTISNNSPFSRDTVQFRHIDYYNVDIYYNPDNYRYVYDPRVNTEYILDKQLNPNVLFVDEVVNGLWLTMPVVLKQTEASHTEFIAKMEELSRVIDKFSSDIESIDEASLHYADFIACWNAVHHFYTYRNRAERMFGFRSLDRLKEGLIQVSSSGSSYWPVREYIALFQDPHATVFRKKTRFSKKKPTKSKETKTNVRVWLPFNRIMIEEKIYVLKSANTKIKPGDQILAINEKESSLLIDSLKSRNVVSPQKSTTSAVNSMGALFNMEEASVRLVRDGKTMDVTVNTISTKEYFNQFNFYKNSYEHQPFEYPDDQTMYINLSLVNSEDFEEKFSEILEVKNLILDIRDYPNHIEKLYAHFSNGSGLGKGLIGSKPLNMYPNQEMKYHIWHSGLKALRKPFIKAKIYVLIGSSIGEGTISRGETNASYLKKMGATLIGDSKTAGAAGGINWITTPGGLRIILTSGYTWRQDGEEMQTIGITPDVFVQQTVKGLKEEKDQVYEAALKLIAE